MKSTGLEEASFQEEEQEDSVKEEFSGEISDDRCSDALRAEPIPSDSHRVIDWATYCIFTRYLALQEA